eukprot:3940526-Rhodomonas_salina.2
MALSAYALHGTDVAYCATWAVLAKRRAVPKIETSASMHKGRYLAEERYLGEGTGTQTSIPRP